MHIESLDSPIDNDNRDYNYSGADFYVRSEFSIIENWVKPDSHVLDLGCGNGSLMKYILDRKNVFINGLEISKTGVDYCLKNGFQVKNAFIDRAESYREFGDSQFDYAVCNVTLQMVHFPEVLLDQMFRVSRRQIISFPNFAFLSNRLDLLFHGRMPKPMLYGYRWYNTGHIHQLSNYDFISYCKKEKIRILRQKHLGCLSIIANIFWPNLFSKVSVFLCEKDNS